MVSKLTEIQDVHVIEYYSRFWIPTSEYKNSAANQSGTVSSPRGVNYLKGEKNQNLLAVQV